MSNQVEYQFGHNDREMYAMRHVYADAGPDAVGPLLLTEYFDGVGWSVDETKQRVVVAGPDDDLTKFRASFMAKALKAGGESGPLDL